MIGELIELADRAKAELPPTDGFTFKFAPDLAKPLPPVEWICEGYSIARESYCVLAGESYGGKSLWTADLALAIAAGKQAVGLYHTKQGPVRWFDYDGQGNRITSDRLQRMARARGYDLADLGTSFGYSWLPRVKLDGDGAYETFARALDGVTFAVIDSWRGACPNTEEKDRGAVQRVGEVLLRIIEKTKCTVMLLDHTIKPPRDSASSDRSEMHDIHGSSAKVELAQWVAVFEKKKDKPVRVLHRKERMEAKTMAPFGLRYEDIAHGDVPRWGLRVVHLDQEQIDAADTVAREAKDAADAERAKGAIRTVLGRYAGVFRGGQQAFRAECGVGFKPFARALGDLVRAGDVIESGTYHKPEWRLRAAS